LVLVPVQDFTYYGKTHAPTYEYQKKNGFTSVCFSKRKANISFNGYVLILCLLF